MTTKNISSVDVESTGNELVELSEAELEATSGGLMMIGTCMGETAPYLGGWGAFEYCFAVGLGLI